MAGAITADYGWKPEPPGSSSYINPAIVGLVRKAGAIAVLDAGCGNGELVAELAKDGRKAVGVDGDQGGIRVARSKFPTARFEVANFADAPVTSTDTADGLFDYVVSTEVVEHLYSPHELAAYCYAALRPGGFLAMSTPYHGYLKNLALSIFNKWDKHHTVNWHGGHIKFWSADTLGLMLRDAGFEISGFVGVGRMPYLWKSMIIVARKPES